MEYNLWLLLHLLIGGYWLGGDMAVFYIAGNIADPKRPLEVRIFSARTMMLLDMIPRCCLILAIGTGLTIASRSGWIVKLEPWLWLAWAGTLAWLALAWMVFLKEHTDIGHTMARVDFYFRFIVLVACMALGVDAFLEGGYVAQSIWLGIKLLLISMIISLGLLVRLILRPFGPLFGAVVTGAATDADQSRLKQLVATVKIPVLAIWLLIVAAMVLGKFKPF